MNACKIVYIIYFSFILLLYNYNVAVIQLRQEREFHGLTSSFGILFLLAAGVHDHGVQMMYLLLHLQCLF